MKFPNFKRINWNYRALAFAFPFLSIVIVMIVSGYTPFGRYSMLYSDMYHQYYPFFASFRRALLSGQSVLYNWDVGMGMDYLGLVSYYLASPLNLLSILVPEKFLLAYFSFLMPVKLGLAGLFFSVFLNKLFHRNDLSITLFGACYALCGWALAYQWNVMWLDTFALLPMVSLGTVSLLKDKKFMLYTLTLFLSIYSNYYIGLFTCIFVALVFFCYEICRYRSFGRLLADLGRIAFFSVLAIGMTAILELPALAALQTTQSSLNHFPTGFKLNIADENTWIGLFDAMRQVAGNMCGGLEPGFKEGLPKLYCGIGTIMLAFLFLTTKKIHIRDKICCVFLLLFFTFSFIIRQLDFIWHGFHFPNMIPYRFSFLFSFVMLYMAYRAWMMQYRFKLWQILAAGCIAAGLVFCSDSRTDPVFLIYNLGLLALYLSAGIYGYYKKRIPADAEEEMIIAIQKNTHRRHRTALQLLSGILVLELIFNVVNFGICFPGTSISNYPKGTSFTASMIRYMKEREKNTPFYRAEVTRTQTLNDGALNNYHGVSTFTSSANVRVTRFMKTLGYPSKDTYNRYCYEIGSPVSEMFLGLKYLIDRDDKPISHPFYTDLHKYGTVHLLKNEVYLPLGFLANTNLADLNFIESNSYFGFQNTLFKTATGLTENVWHNIPNQNLTVFSDDVNITAVSQGNCHYEAPEKGGILVYEYQIARSGFMCISLDLAARNYFTVYKNGTEIYSDNISLAQMTAADSVVPGDVVRIEIKCKGNEKSWCSIKAAILDESVFLKGYQILSASVLDVHSFKNTEIKGSVHCNRDGYLYTSIPQNGNWFAEVDGKPAEIKLTGDAMVGLLLSEGPHEIRFFYHNAAFALGWKISLGCTAVLFLVKYISDQSKSKKGKYRRRNSSES